VLKVTITERHCEVSKKMLTRTEEQVGGLGKYDQRATHAEVTYTDEKHTRKVEIVVHVDGSGQVVAHGEGDDFRGALSQAVERTRRMLRERRQKRRDHQAPPLSDGVVTE
jgi:ribosomal subunit interface protein